MSRRDNGAYRCSRCAMHQSLCICAHEPRLSVASRLSLVLHRDEARKTTNTGRLAARCLSGSEVLVHGRKGEPVLAPWLGGEGGAQSSLVLFPCDQAEVLTREHLRNGPVRLVVPDGTWRQAAKMTKRIPWMRDLPRVSLPAGGAKTSYRLRSEHRAGGLATMEAIARAFAVLEGPEVEAKLYEIFCMMIDRTLYSRGSLAREDVFGGVPEGVRRHDPRRHAQGG